VNTEITQVQKTGP